MKNSYISPYKTFSGKRDILRYFDVHDYIGKCGHDIGLVGIEKSVVKFRDEHIILIGSDCCKDLFLKECEKRGRLPKRLGFWD